MPSIWTPQGEVPIVNQKGVVPISQQDIITLSKFHEFAQRQGLALVCLKCDTSVTGANTGQGNTASVACQCREFRYTAG